LGKVVHSEGGFQIALNRCYGVAKGLIVTFNPMGRDIEQSGFGSSFARDEGYDNLHVSERHWSFYQDLSLEAFAEHASPVAQEYEHVFTYGSSLGGYAALYFAGTLNATAISFSPQLPPAPYARAIKGESHKFSGVAVKHIALPDAPKSQHAPYVCFDPMHKVDRTFVNTFLLSAYPNANIRHEKGGHKPIAVLKERGLLKPMVRDILSGDPLRRANWTAVASGDPVLDEVA